MFDRDSIDEEAEREGNALRRSFKGKRTHKTGSKGPSMRDVSTDHRTPGVDFLALRNVINGVATND